MLHLSIVIPAYNEERRLPRTLERMLPYLRARSFESEILVVDDGSTDGTAGRVRGFAARYPEIRLISDGINRGRGAAVKKGIFEAQGALILETDSDGSVADEAIGRFVEAFDKDLGLAAVFGSREMDGAVVATRQPLMRVILGYGFLYLARCLFRMWSTTDFTLGFKMYRRDAARDIFAHQFDRHYVAEAEKVFVAKIRGHAAIEMPVTWTNDRDSRVRPLRDIPRALSGLAAILVRSALGRYR